MKLVLSVALVLCSLARAQVCTEYLKVVGQACAQACLNKTVGICPVALVVKAGGLHAGKCASEGFTQANGTISQKAGPCGTIKFDEFVKPAPTKPLGGSSSTATHAGDITLASFDGAAGTSFKWVVVDDPVMGGKSHSRLDTGTSAPGGMAHWYGEVAIVPFLHSPGFCTIRTEGDSSFPNVTGTTLLKLFARNNASSQLERFTLQLTTEGGRAQGKKGTYSGNVTIPSSGEWVEVASRWSEFSFTWHGEPLDGPDLTSQLDQITSVGLSTFFPGKVGSFDLDIKWLRAGN